MNTDKIGGLIFLVLSAAYGYSASMIPPMMGEEMEPLTPRSFPYAIAAFGVFFSLLLIIKPSTTPNQPTFILKSYDWKLTISLLVLMLIYGFLLAPLGFMLATLLFLMGGYYLMGERRPKTLLLASVPLVLAFWFLLAKVLGVYLEAGSLWQ